MNNFISDLDINNLVFIYFTSLEQTMTCLKKNRNNVLFYMRILNIVNKMYTLCYREYNGNFRKTNNLYYLVMH